MSRPALGQDNKPCGCWHVGPVLLRVGRPEIALLSIGEDEEDEKRRILSFVRSPRPEGDAPPSVVTADRRAGGALGLENLMIAAREGGALGVAVHCARFDVDARHWRCNLVPRSVAADGRDASVLRIGVPARVEHIGYRFEAGANGIEEVDLLYLHEEELYRVIVQCRAGLALEPGTLRVPAAFEAIDLAFDCVFTSSAGNEGSHA